MARIFNEHNIDTIYHAAAYKHVPLVQERHNISKSAQNNFIGTFNFANQAVKAKIPSFVLISTDKAVRPTNVMGASKRMAEISVQALNASTDSSKLSMVRFGNVINSSGSVIPLFLDQIARGGPVTLTHRDVMRYFMTIPEASNLVLQAGEISKGGEVFILDMGVEVGLREGEKMYEELLISGNEEKTTNPKIYKSNEEFIGIDELKLIIDECNHLIESDNFIQLTNIMSQYVEGFKYE